jgi:hypothetical protein
MTFSLMNKLVINGHEEFTVYKGCVWTAAKGLCQCGFRRYTKAGYFNDKQLQDVKDHVKATNHTLTISLSAAAKERTKT